VIEIHRKSKGPAFRPGNSFRDTHCP
jgi:hypothetical protein